MVTASSKKIFCLLDIFQLFLNTHDHQSGFKTKYSADIKACISIPGISDDSIVLANCDLKATINKKPPRKVYQWSKADWQLVKEQTVIFAKQFLALALTRTVKENYTAFI